MHIGDVKDASLLVRFTFCIFLFKDSPRIFVSYVHDYTFGPLLTLSYVGMVFNEF